jgi:hypothetical protein
MVDLYGGRLVASGINEFDLMVLLVLTGSLVGVETQEFGKEKVARSVTTANAS